jgi:WD40 repeat protein
VVTATYDRTAVIWDIKTGKQLGEKLQHEGDVYSAGFSPDGLYVVTASYDNTAVIWEIDYKK